MSGIPYTLPCMNTLLLCLSLMDAHVYTQTQLVTNQRATSAKLSLTWLPSAFTTGTHTHRERDLRALILCVVSTSAPAVPLFCIVTSKWVKRSCGMGQGKIRSTDVECKHTTRQKSPAAIRKSGS